MRVGGRACPAQLVPAGLDPSVCSQGLAGQRRGPPGQPGGARGATLILLSANRQVGRALCSLSQQLSPWRGQSTLLSLGAA